MPVRGREEPGPPRSPDEIQPQELVITLFGAYVREDPRPAWSGGLVELLAAFGFSAGAARIALNRVVDRGLLERHRDGRFVSYAPTARTLELIRVGDVRLAELAGDAPWDGTWTVVWYSIPDDLRRERHRVGRRLRFLGFGPLEDSTWVAPRDRAADVLPYLDRLAVRDRVGVFVGTHALAPDLVVARAWDSAELAARYRLFVQEFAAFDGRELDDGEAFVVRTRLVNAFRRFPYLDPGLPQELFAAAESRSTAVALFGELYPALEVRAQRFFDRATRRS